MYPNLEMGKKTGRLVLRIGIPEGDKRKRRQARPRVDGGKETLSRDSHVEIYEFFGKHIIMLHFGFFSSTDVRPAGQFPTDTGIFLKAGLW